MSVWNPWRGCHKYSEGCKFCYIHKGDAKRGVDTSHIEKTRQFTAPVEKYVRGAKTGQYKMQPGGVVYLGFATDFLLQEGDQWRAECWRMIRERSDLHFLFLTKRIERFMDCIPQDWGDGYENVTVGCTIENQEMADYRLSIFENLPIKHKNIICQPLIEKIDIGQYLNGIELVVVGGESDTHARPLDYDWVLSIREQCIRKHVHFDFRQCGSNFLKDGTLYRLNVRQLFSQARKAGINV